jgi:hypothetical protein
MDTNNNAGGESNGSNDQGVAQAAMPGAEAGEKTLLATETTGTTGTKEGGEDAGAQGVEKPEWLPEKFWRNDAADVESLAKSYQGLEQLLGKKAKAVVPPDEKSSPEEWATWRKTLGVPDKPEDYKIKPEQLPEGFSWDEQSAKRVAEVAHKHNIPAAALQDLVKFDLERQQMMQQAAISMAQQELESGREELKRVYGDKMDEKITLAKRAALTVGANPLSRGFVDPEVMKAFVSLAEKLSDDKLVAGDQTTASSSRARARDIMTNKANPMYARYQEGDPEVVDQVRRMLTSAS